MDYIGQEQIGLFEKQKSNDWKWSLKDYPKKNGLKVFSCFSCAGGSTMGYKLAGFDVIGNCEIDPRMNEIYVKNHHPKHNFCMDIRDFNNLENLPDDLYNLDVLDGSPPCTTFSMAGQREESWGVKKKFREGQKEQTLDDLSFVFIKTAKKLQPKVVIMENVEGLLLGEAWKYVQKIYSCFNDAGYNVKHWLCKGENMGIPQQRHRVFFIAVRKDIHFDINGMYMDFDYEPVTYSDVKCGKHKKAQPGTKLYALLSNAKQGENDLGYAHKRLFKKDGWFQAAILDDDRVLPTMRAKFPDNYHRETFERQNSQEIILCQTFPQDFDFINFSDSNIAYICGMSVPPVMMKRIASKVHDEIFGGGNYE